VIADPLSLEGPCLTDTACIESPLLFPDDSSVGLVKMTTAPLSEIFHTHDSTAKLLWLLGPMANAPHKSKWLSNIACKVLIDEDAVG